MDASTSAADRITGQQLREAREGLTRLLHKKRFPREWIEREVPDAIAEAEKDFAARLAAGKEDDIVNLLVVIAYRRAIKMLRAQLAEPTTSIETVFHLRDESTPSPEEEAIRHDQNERVMEAMGHLPERERMLLTFCYYDDMSIREAGRKVGWGKSSADRHHRAALEKLRALLDPRP
ncbi:MAG: RNA polymerase sigma factor [Solirubrobacterales bacterium]